MPVIAYRPKPENSIIVECKKCGMRVRVLRSQRQTLKIRCRACGGVKFRTVTE